MNFSPHWLALRADADRRARSDLVARAAALADTMPRPLHIVDLGAGTGASVREIAPHITPPQCWTLADADADLLTMARADLKGIMPGLKIVTRVVDLNSEPPWLEPPHLVTATALFDITSIDFIERFADRLAAARIPLLSMLTYDGRLSVTPEHPFDATMIAAFNDHQRGVKSFGRAAGPEAADALTRAFTARGARVETADSPWQLEAPTDTDLMQAKFGGWASAAAEMMPDRQSEIHAWREARRDAKSIFVGHQDHLVLF